MAASRMEARHGSATGATTPLADQGKSSIVFGYSATRLRFLSLATISVPKCTIVLVVLQYQLQGALNTTIMNSSVFTLLSLPSPSSSCTPSGSQS
jgi:hypothetical protein